MVYRLDWLFSLQEYSFILFLVPGLTPDREGTDYHFHPNGAPSYGLESGLRNDTKGS